jgi:mevalonate kinase
MVPSKTFLYGEYAVLRGGKGCVVAHEPWFTLEAHLSCEQNSFPFHAESPAGRFISQNSALKKMKLLWRDPHGGVGGFGGSTAEYNSVLQAGLSVLGRPFRLQNEWEKYRELIQSKGSGADFIAQALGGICEVQILSSAEGRSPQVRVESRSWPFKDVEIYWWKTSQKVKTHEDLQQKISLDMELNQLVFMADKISAALSQGKKEDFFAEMKEFYQELARLGLQDPAVVRDAQEWMSGPGVLFAKGCGAQGADVFMIFVDKSADLKLRQDLENRGIRYYGRKDITEGVKIRDNTY